MLGKPHILKKKNKKPKHFIRILVSLLLSLDVSVWFQRRKNAISEKMSKVRLCAAHLPGTTTWTLSAQGVWML